MVTGQTVVRGVKNAGHVLLGLVKFIVPAVVVMKLLEHSGALQALAAAANPLMQTVGLPGETALPILLAQVSLYSGIGALGMLGLSVKVATICSTILAIFHALPLETSIVQRAGANGLLIFVIRLLAAIAAALLLGVIL